MSERLRTIRKTAVSIKLAHYPAAAGLWPARKLSSKRRKSRKISAEEIRAGVDAYRTLFGTAATAKIQTHIKKELKEHGETFRYCFLQAVSEALVYEPPSPLPAPTGDYYAGGGG